MRELQLTKEQEDRARALHKQAIVVDMALTGSFGHPAPEVNGKSYLDRALAAGLTVAGQTLEDTGFRAALTDVNVHHRLLRQKPDKLLLVTRSKDFYRAKEEGKIGLVLGFQNAAPLEDDWLNLLPVFYALGVRVVQLTYNERNLAGSGCQEPQDFGLTAYGRQLVLALNGMGVSVDLSHCGDRTTMEAIELSRDPVLITHANPRALNSNSRNKTDDVLKAAAERGGVICCVAWNVLCETKEGVFPTVVDYVDHIEYIANLVGIDHVGVGSDINENFRALPVRSSFEETYSFMLGPYADNNSDPKGFSSVDDYPNLTRALVARGFSDSDIMKILGLNVLQVVERVWDRNK